jgi:hypothetical protein
MLWTLSLFQRIMKYYWADNTTLIPRVTEKGGK